MKKIKIIFLVMIIVFVVQPVMGQGLSLSVDAVAQTLTWQNASKGNVVGYIVYFTDDVTDPDKYQKIMIGEQNTSVAFDELNLQNGVDYEFYVTAYNEAGESPESNHVTATTSFTINRRPRPFVLQGDRLPPNVP